MARKVTKRQQQKALAAVAEWLGPQMGYKGSAPTGDDAAYRGYGPALNPAWDWPSAGPTPTIILESGYAPDDWAVVASYELVAQFDRIGVFAEPYSSYALCLYPKL
jgi:hypothetical protein